MGKKKKQEGWALKGIAIFLLGVSAGGCQAPMEASRDRSTPAPPLCNEERQVKIEGIYALTGTTGQRNEVIESRAQAAPFEPLLVVASSPASVGFVEMACRPIEEKDPTFRGRSPNHRVFLVRELDSTEDIVVEAEIKPEEIDF